MFPLTFFYLHSSSDSRALPAPGHYPWWWPSTSSRIDTLDLHYFPFFSFRFPFLLIFSSSFSLYFSYFIYIYIFFPFLLYIIIIYVCIFFYSILNMRNELRLLPLLDFLYTYNMSHWSLYFHLKYVRVACLVIWSPLS